MEMACISCEVVVTVCTIVYLFHCRRMKRADSTDIAVEFVSLAATLVSMAVVALSLIHI